ncbi:hypothetical protein C0J52_23030 [Blattella germanica]|nr:hypothetical protein C0J52_23030 [Blattella germanica]
MFERKNCSGPRIELRPCVTAALTPRTMPCSATVCPHNSCKSIYKLIFRRVCTVSYYV